MFRDMTAYRIAATSQDLNFSATVIRLFYKAAGLLSLFLDLAAKNTFRIAWKDFGIARKEGMTLILGIIMAMSWP